MKAEWTGAARIALMLAMAMGCGWAQQPLIAKHASDIRKEQPWPLIAASPLCQKVRANPETEAMHTYKVPAAALIPDLTGLMEKSDEVILSSGPMDRYDTIAPSGQDAIEYVDVKVLQSWKGSHRPGEIVTFAIPTARIECSLSRPYDEPHFTTLTGPGGWEGIRTAGPLVLFLRRSQGSETELTPGLRLTGGGVQGLFEINFHALIPHQVVHLHQRKAVAATILAAVNTHRTLKCVCRF